MKRKELGLVMLTVVLLLVSVPISAHHGVAAYEIEVTTTLEGTVTGFQWENPHALINFDVKDDRGIGQQWTAETAGLVLLVRAGWNKNSLKPGDQCKIVGHRAKNGTNTMILKHLVLSNGKELNNFIP